MTAEVLDVGGVGGHSLDADDVGVRTALRVGRWLARHAPLLPFFVYVTMGILVPSVAIVKLAFTNSSTGAATWSNFDAVFTQHQYLFAMATSLKLAALTSIVPAIAGTVLAYVIATSRFATLKRLVTTASGVLANFGGVNLAFIFIATAGPTGLAIKWLSALGWNPWDHGFDLFQFSGIAIVYMYFQIPLMVLVITPALAGLKTAWREAAANLGANWFQYWWRVGLPVLMPSLLSSTLLLFGSALSAYATAEALTGGLVALMPIQIGSFFGNVLSSGQNVAYAIASVMIGIIILTMAPYVYLQRRASRWSR